jgi:7-cyano-7-deazaguanine synthase
VLLSGGLDSATVLAIARNQGYECHALSFDYGQRHARELDSARRLASALAARAHLVLRLDLRAIGGSALTADIAVPDDRDGHVIGAEIPVTYVPARNTIMLSLALGWAEVIGSSDLFCGVNAVDYSGYPDCRPEFIEAFSRMAQLATRAGVEGTKIAIHTPLIEWSKAEIIRRATGLGVDLADSVSCYQPDDTGRACGRCDSCRLRRAGFESAGLPDVTRYIDRRSTA